jgi:hypothetical protein
MSVRDASYYSYKIDLINTVERSAIKEIKALKKEIAFFNSLPSTETVPFDKKKAKEELAQSILARSKKDIRAMAKKHNKTIEQVTIDLRLEWDLSQEEGRRAECDD